MSNTGMDGLIGFGQADSSIISQLASSNEAPKIFSHCLDSVNGGGIFAVGTSVLPKMESTPLIPTSGAAVGDAIIKMALARQTAYAEAAVVVEQTISSIRTISTTYSPNAEYSIVSTIFLFLVLKVAFERISVWTYCIYSA